MSYILNFELLDGKTTLAKGSAIDQELNLDKLIATAGEFCRIKIDEKNDTNRKAGNR